MENDGISPVEKGAEALGLRRQNALLELYGMSLSAAQAKALRRREQQALMESGRIEFGEGIMTKLIYALCDSPWLAQNSLTEVLEAMTYAFYYYKKEADGYLSDDELIEAMADCFNGKAQGSVEYMSETSLYDLVRTMKRGNEDG